MFSALRDERGSACISDMAFDAWLGEELGAAEARHIVRHLEECGPCRRRKLQLVREREKFSREFPAVPEWLDGEGASPPRSRRATWLVSGLCAAAAVGLFMLPRSSEVRTKGREQLGFYVKRGERVHRGQDRERLVAGDQLRFAYTAPADCYLAILSLDGAKHANTYFPAGGRAARIEAGTNVLLPSAIELDAVLGEEHIVGVFCDAAVDVAPLAAALEEDAARFEPPSGCAIDELVVIKRAGAP